ncbi:MAG: alpha/beta fold hydrolase [Armatimonadetes bacterium]|nr:alpha/beta fold hydrolase [Akkermansiaceae bacterium]
MKFPKKLLIAGYLLLLVASWITMSNRSAPLPATGNWREFRIPLAHSESAPLRYRIFLGSDPSKPPVLLLHGSPMASHSFDALIEKLPRDRTYIIPDLPGFGESAFGFTDYSFIAQAKALDQLLERETTIPAHVVAYSQGGGPALELYAISPGKIASLTLLSSIGVQEHELTGDYFLNHTLHGVQLTVLTAIRWAMPHFGLLDDFLLNTRYAKNFYQGDMRPLRSRLENFHPPAIIIHGEADGLVPASAAREHHRILPQSSIRWLEGGHMALFSKPAQIEKILTPFFLLVDSGNATTRSQATAARIAAAREPFSNHPRKLTNATLYITLFGIAFATFASEDLACLIAGLLAARGIVPLPDAMLACFAGIWTGDMLLYFIGRYGGRWLVTRRPLRWLISPRSLASATTFLNKRGAATILATRFMPGTRLPLYLAAGIVRLPIHKMALWFAIAAALWAFPVVALVAYFGEKTSEWLMESGKLVFPSVIIFLFLAWLITRLASSLATHQGRRILLAKYHRLTRWEFWPAYVLYIPVILALIPTAIRRRNLLAITACNPGIPHSGIIGESKSQILTHLLSSGKVPDFILIPENAPDKPALAQTWIARNQLTYPLVIKPDTGERGSGVRILHSPAELHSELTRRTEPTILQAYIPGDEFGILYIFPPGEKSPHISSLTRKTLTHIICDGTRTLRQLILDDPRAYLSHRYFFQTHQERLDTVPPAGEKIILAPLGTHCRGSLFLNGSDLITPALTAEIHRISQTFPGFHLGRYDIRCPSEADLIAGKNLRIIELNGLTSEPTHIYHPHTPFASGLRALISQWRTAHAIGVMNAVAGAKTSSFRELFHLLRVK